RRGNASGLDWDETGRDLPSRDRCVASDSSDRTSPQLDEALWRVRREQEAPGHRPRVGSVLVGDGLGEGAGPAIGLSGAVGDVVDPCPGVAGGPGVVGEIGHQARFADAGLALDDERAARSSFRKHLPQSGPLRVTSDELPDRRSPWLEPGFAEQASNPDWPGLASQDLRSALLDREVLPRGAHGCLVQKNLAWLGQRL